MKLHEYQAKNIFRDAGLKVPMGGVADTPEEAEEIAKGIEGDVAVKAQVHVGGRGKAGGIKVVSTDEARSAAEQILGMDLKGNVVESVLVEEAIDIQEEIYVGVTTDRSRGMGVGMISSEGGVNIEEVAEENPDAISKVQIDPAYGLMDFQSRSAAFKAGVPGEHALSVGSVLKKLYGLWERCDADDAEINPLVITGGGDIIAADAVFNIDDSALYRQEELAEMREESFEDSFEAEASERGFDYVRLDGNIGVIGNGAGLVMATLDLVEHHGGRPANFLDIGGGADSERVKDALSLVFEDDNVEAVIFNIFGGITRCDEVAKGINDALPDELPKPLVVRLTGTNEEEGREILTEKVYTEQGMDEAVKTVISLSRGDSR